jgi:hypothetical protein
LIADSITGSGFEYVNYTGISGNQFTGLTRGKASTTVGNVAAIAGNSYLSTTSSVANVQAGMFVYGPGIPNNTYVYAITPGAPNNIIQMSQAATGTTSNTLSFQAMATAAATHPLSTANTMIPIYLHTPQFAPTMSHWGTSVIMDGRYDDDKSLQFVNGETSITAVPAGQSYALQSIRVSPSVDSGTTGVLGAKELINRMQLTPQAVEVIVNGSFLIQLVLNGQIVSNGGTIGNFAKLAVGTSSLAQFVDHTGNVGVTGGETIYGFYAVNNAGSFNYSTVNADLTKIRDLGNSILGGGLTNAANTGFYPDGPDILTIVATNIGTGTANAQARFSWTEAQA